MISQKEVEEILTGEYLAFSSAPHTRATTAKEQEMLDKIAVRFLERHKLTYFVATGIDDLENYNTYYFAKLTNETKTPRFTMDYKTLMAALDQGMYIRAFHQIGFVLSELGTVLCKVNKKPVFHDSWPGKNFFSVDHTAICFSLNFKPTMSKD